MREQICNSPEGSLSFAGLEIHAAEGIHEKALAILSRVVRPGARIADLGAGSGAFSVRLRSAGYDPVAVDINVDDRPEGIPFLEADIMDLNSVFEPGSLPAAVAIESIEHLRDPIGFIQSVLHVLEPTGVFLATTPNVTHPYSRLKFSMKGTFWLFTPELYQNMGHITPLPEWLLRAHLANAGFRDIEHGFVGCFEFRGVKRLLISAIRSRLHSEGAQLGVDGDGSNVIVVARKP
jgi:SAM-dependent methyltransferase